jgi:hypothetical protein
MSALLYLLPRLAGEDQGGGCSIADALAATTEQPSPYPSPAKRERES